MKEFTGGDKIFWRRLYKEPILRINKIETKMYFTIIRLPKMYVYVNRNNYALQKILMYIKEYLPPEYYKFICSYNGIQLGLYITGSDSMKLVPVNLKITPKMVKLWDQWNKIYSDPRGIKPDSYYVSYKSECHGWYTNEGYIYFRRTKKKLLRKTKYYYCYDKQSWIPYSGLYQQLLNLAFEYPRQIF